ncbi:MAG: alpha/beta hydrolase [Pyrinomonadaceae bacterium]|nr:alpha/beta hydrolase [Pyrinomonadaceae bacterium]MBP6214310.1 alpha/beta hydrolase [Pyrinomonadaceae bacterium]
MCLRIEEVQIPVAGGILAGTFTRPANSLANPSILLISGSGANDRDETVCGQRPFRIIADYFSALGYAVLRCDDRGIGGSTGNVEDHEFAAAVSDVVTLYDWLTKQPTIDSERITLLGHSEGGLIAAVAGSQVNAWAVVMLGGPSVPIEDLLHEQASMISKEYGATAAQLRHEREMNEQVFALARSDLARSKALTEIEAVIQDHLRTWPDAEKLSEDDVRNNAQIMSNVVGASAYRSLLRQDPALILAGFTGRILAVYGGLDTQVPGVANAEAFRESTSNNPLAGLRLFPDHNHLFQRAKTGSISEYENLPPGPTVEVMREISVWLAAHARAYESSPEAT